MLIHGNEAIWGGDKRQLGKLKSMVTERYCIIEGKGKDQLTMRNFKHLILSSNEDWPVHLDRDDRRFLTLNVSNKYKGDAEYFNLLHEEINGEGLAAFLDELQKVDLDFFDVWKIPQNIEAFEVKLESASSAEKYIYNALLVGSFDLGVALSSCVWLESEQSYKITVDAMFMDYKLWCEHNSYKTENVRIFGKAVSRLIPSSIKTRTRENGRKAQYELPPIKKARSDFEKIYKIGTGVWEQ